MLRKYYNEECPENNGSNSFFKCLFYNRFLKLKKKNKGKSWRRKWQPTPVFLPGKSNGQRSLVGYSLWGLKELDMTEAT